MAEDSKTDDLIEEIATEETQANANAQPEPSEGSSLASKVLTGLVLIVGGGIAALWAGPQIAPQLPAGLAPVAEFLAPQDQTDFGADIAAVTDAQNAFQEQVTARLQQLEQADQSLSGDLSDLTDQVAGLPTTNASGAADLAQANAAIDDLRDRVAALAVRIEGLNAGGSDAVLGGDVVATQRAIASLRADLDRLSAAQAGLETQFETVTGDLQSSLEAAQGQMATVTEAAKLQVGTAQNRQLVVELERSLENGAPFTALLNNSEINLPAEIAAVASSGTATLDELQTTFPDLAYAAIRADLTPTEGAGLTDRLTSFLGKQVATRSLSPIEGDSTDAILSRMEAALNNGDLAAVLSEAEGMGSAPRAAMADWLSDVSGRHAAFEALARFASGQN